MKSLFSALLLSALMFAAPVSGWAEQSKSSAETKVSKPAEKTDRKPNEKEQSVTFKSLAQMNELIELGVPALALSLLEDEQKKRPAFSADWYSFEYKRILLLAALERWQSVIDRTQWLFDTAKKNQHITKKIRLWFETQQVIARLQ